MGIEFHWENSDHTALRYTASGDWNWKDYHLAVRHSLLNLKRDMQNIDSIIDIRTSTRDHLPAGLPSHVRTFGKRFHESLSGRAIAIGFPAEIVATLTEGRGWMATPGGGVVRFVENDEQVQSVLNEWRQG